ncbi:2Fe-2S iron-sulfur cluster-binding protein [Actinoplanes sp. NPDC051470]|uniref:2Fe-2S iron-sulfur cluster-binding protein n=1 Tax=unclassified Actinoplanes TaxID=2626549 RepID=UPI003434A375
MPLITVSPDGPAVDVAPGETIVEGLRRVGWRARYRCRGGGCGICKCPLVAGAVTYLGPVAESALSAAERSAGLCLPCRAVPLGDVVIEQRERPLRSMLASAPRMAAPTVEER